MSSCWKVVRANQPSGSVRKGSVSNLLKMHAMDHTTLSPRPLIVRDIEEHMLGREEAEGVSCVSNVQAYGSYKLGYTN